ncbi:MAG: DUF5123 domain-containing protein, partial [Candidatus Eisenbacteria bacterium]|nr:DUF5123 domain-containing protein [Candidatus Eisenbacteria bacterium]
MEYVSISGFNIMRRRSAPPIIANYLASISLRDCLVEDFLARIELVYVRNVVIEDCIFRSIKDQNFDLGGGALLIAALGESVIRRCQFIDNSSPHGFPSWEHFGGGGALFVSAAEPFLITECLFLRNEAPTAGAVITVGPVEFSHNTLVGNTSGDAAYVHAEATSRITENVFAWNNSFGLRCWSGDLNNSCNSYWQNEGTEEGFCGPNYNILLDPQFCDPDNDDFHLLETSPLLPENRPDGYEICDGIFGAFGMGCVG